VGEGDPLSWILFVVNDHVFGILSGMDGEILIASPLQHRHALDVLRVRLDGLRDAVPFDESVGIDVASMER